MAREKTPVPVCPRCRTEYRPGFDTCADCGSPIEQLEAAQEIARSVEEVAVARYAGQPEAEMWAEVLRGEGIPAVVVQLLPAARLAWGMVPAEVRVRATDLERARAILGDQS